MRIFIEGNIFEKRVLWGENSIKKHETFLNGERCILITSAELLKLKSSKTFRIFQLSNKMTTVLKQQSDLVTSATLSSNGKDSMKNEKTASSNLNKGKISIINGSDNNKSNIIKANLSSNINNNNIITANKNSNNNITKLNPNGHSDMQHKINTTVNNAVASISESKSGNHSMSDARQVLKEAVDAVVNSFTKHTQSYGRGEFQFNYLITIIIVVSASRRLLS